MDVSTIWLNEIKKKGYNLDHRLIIEALKTIDVICLNERREKHENKLYMYIESYKKYYVNYVE